MEGASEKVSVNMNVGTLSQIDLLVDLGYYSNRSAVRSIMGTGFAGSMPFRRKSFCAQKNSGKRSGSADTALWS